MQVFLDPLVDLEGNNKVRKWKEGEERERT